MLPHPATADAIRTLHGTWLRRVGQWRRQIGAMSEMEAHQRRNVLLAVRDHLHDQLLPYMRLEEGLLSTDGTLEGDLLRVEHAAIRRAIEHLDEVATAEEVSPHEAQAGLARLCATLTDHLLHEASAYLPRLVPST